VELREHVPLAPYTTFGLGGKARYFVECGSEDEVRAALAYAAERRLPAYVLGGGSNVVFLDSGFPGLILRLTIVGSSCATGRALRCAPAPGSMGHARAKRGAARLDRGRVPVWHPGTVGGTPIQNVGAYGQEISESLVSVECLDRTTLERGTFTARECAFGYRDSRFNSARIEGGMSCSRSRCGWLAISGRASAIRSCSAPWRSSRARHRCSGRGGPSGT